MATLILAERLRRTAVGSSSMVTEGPASTMVIQPALTAASNSSRSVFVLPEVFQAAGFTAEQQLDRQALDSFNAPSQDGGGGMIPAHAIDGQGAALREVGLLAVRQGAACACVAA